MKKLYVVIAVCLVLAGCSNETSEASDGSSGYSVTGSTKAPETSENSQNSSVISSESSETSAISSSETSAEEDPELNASPSEFLVGLAGDAIPAENFITDIRGITRGKFMQCEAKGTYVAVPSGIFRTSLDNPDVFDSENRCFTDISAERKKDFIRIEEGDEICGFKVKKAVSVFAPEGADEPYKMPDGTMKKGTELGFPEIYFRRGELELEGTVEMTGYIRIVAEDVYGMEAGDIRFIPAECKPALPVLNYDFDPSEGFYHDIVNCYMEEGIAFCNEYGCGCFKLGNKSETTADLGFIPADGSFIKAKVIVKNISMDSTIDWFTNVRGELVSIGAV